LYEALYGERPFAGDSILALSLSVTEGQLRPLPKDREVPGWIRRALMRGLSTKASQRFTSMAALIALLEDDPAVRRRRRLLVGGAAGLALAGVIVAAQIIHRRRAEFERRVSAHLDQAARETAAARDQARALRSRRGAAY